MSAAAFLLASLLAGGCSSTSPLPAPAQRTNVAADAKPWLPYAEYSFAIERDGLPAPTTQVAIRGDIADDPEEKLVWRSLVGLRPKLTFNQKDLAPKDSLNYSQKIDPRTGVIATKWSQPGVGDVSLKIQGRGLGHTLQVQITPTQDGMIEGECPSSVETGVPPGAGFTDFSLGFTPGGKAKIALEAKANETVLIELQARLTHKQSPLISPQPPRIRIEGPPEDQAAIDNLLFQITGYVGGLGPFGLTSERYFGHVFWDADAWVFPSLALLSPDQAAQISDYRWQTREGARQNFDAWLKEGRPIGGEEKLLGSEHSAKGTAYKFAWESSRSGRETAPGESRHQEHIGGTVARSLETSSALGLISADKAQDISQGVANYYLSRMEWGNNALEMRGVMSADEYHIGRNDLYTNLLAEHLFLRYLDQSKPLRVALPRDQDGNFLTYEGDQMRAYQQAAAVLAIFPLQNAEAEAEAIAMLERFAPKVMDKGPAMSHSLHALIRARFGEANAAHQEWRAAYDRYAKPPFQYISERPTTQQTVFVTGAAGFINTVLYGFAGIRIDEEPWPNADWKMPLKDGWWISGRANLPSQWTSLTIPDLKILGQSYKLTARQDGSTLTANRKP